MSNEASMSTSLSSATPQSTDASINEEANTTRTNQSHVSYLGDTSLYISNKIISCIHLSKRKFNQI